MKNTSHEAIIWVTSLLVPSSLRSQDSDKSGTHTTKHRGFQFFV